MIITRLTCSRVLSLLSLLEGRAVPFWLCGEDPAFVGWAGFFPDDIAGSARPGAWKWLRGLLRPRGYASHRAA